MCVIAYMDSTTRLEAQDIALMFDANPDGAGLCYPFNGKVIIRKGYFTLEELLEEYGKVPAGVPVILHCRIATSGKIDARTCHPFAVATKLKRTNRRSCGLAFAHNGVLSGLGSKVSSDTQEYVSQVVAPLVHKARASRLADMEYILRIIEATSQGCRFAFMDYTGDVRLVGTWYDYKGCKVSNLSFMQTNYAWARARANTQKYPLEFNACLKCDDARWCKEYGACCSTEQEAEWSSGYSEDTFLEPSWYLTGGDN